MKVVHNEAYERFVDAADALSKGTRIKDVRDAVLKPGGRAELRLFDAVEEGRPHPRMRCSMPPAVDPAPPAFRMEPAVTPRTAAMFAEAVAALVKQYGDTLAGADLARAAIPEQSPKYWRNSIRCQRTAALFALARSHLDRSIGAGVIPSHEAEEARLALAQAEAEAFAGVIEFDDEDTGTYHSYGHDAPFVHYLEQLLDSLPAEGSEAMALLPDAAAESVRRQRRQTQTHLDDLMRHKYAYEVIEESDIERTLGGLLIDRKTRAIASEKPDQASLTPQYELLRVDPASSLEHAGAWIYRDGGGRLHLQDGTEIELDPAVVLSAPVDAEQLTFLRANHDRRLRPGLRFDWDGNNYIQAGRIDWVSWAGHCDIKAIMEQLGVTLGDDPSVTEFRSDTGTSKVYDRRLLLEMVASAMEFGSRYRYIDGTGVVSMGEHHFGGARNDALPDRLQFKGQREGRSFRWPLRGRQEAFRVTAIQWPESSPADLDTVFLRYTPDRELVDFAPNPRYLKTVEGDYNLIDVTGAKLEAELLVDSVDPVTGYLRQTTEKTVIELRDGAAGGHDGRFFLGTHLDDEASRRIYRMYWDARSHEISAELYVYRQVEGRWEAERVPGESLKYPMAAALRCTLSREMKSDDPAQFQALLSIALREGRNICADTDRASAVWNGVCTRLESRRIAINEERRVEHWKVDLEARFGRATLEYLVRRDERGIPSEFCPLAEASGGQPTPDFLWHDLPDVGSKGVVNGRWVVNQSMFERGVVAIEADESVPSGFYVYDDHVKNTYELIFCGLATYPYTIVHDNKRYGFRQKSDWKQAIEGLTKLRAGVSFEGPRPT